MVSKQQKKRQQMKQWYAENAEVKEETSTEPVRSE